MVFKIVLICPDCGRDEWHTLQHAEPGEYCCCNCGTVCTLEEMSAAETTEEEK